ncbi:MAG TPA: ATP-binding protein [Bryobacteraceae bacterium]|jgi:signal transduction histidine kinase|nr:ATP-binding protein [Bryobacteraceae bacterium]
MFKVRATDALLAVMFGTLIFLAHDAWERSFLLEIAVLQIVEGRISFLNSLRGRITLIVLQIVILYLLIGLDGGIQSSYYIMLLLPIVSAAGSLGIAGTLATSFAAVAVYLSFLLFVNFKEVDVPPEQLHILVIRCLPLVIAAIIVNTLSAVIRTQSAQYKSTAEELAAANKSLVEAEAAVRRSERLAALGQLSAGLAHELRNPLGSIKGSADLLARSASRNDPMAKELGEIISAEVDRTNSLVTRFLNFARPLEPRRELTDVTAVIDRAAARAKVDVIRDYSPSLPRLSIDAELMEQVFLNLIANAAQASESGGPVTVRTREVAGRAELSVIDRGCGIPKDKIETVFNPFVTTKQDGVGLGLAIVSKIVDGHGGKMAVESEPGKGSTFRVLLPIPTKQKE